MISVAMTTYNSCRHSEYLKAQLDSIRNQAVAVDEVVIVDDASKDETVHYVSEYIEKNNLNHNWRLYQNPSNLGFIGAFSRALSLTQGDIVLLCDHDDIWLPDKVKIILKVFQRNPGILSLNTGFINIDENGKVLPAGKSFRKSNNGLIRRKVKHGKLNRMCMDDVLVYNISPGCTCAVKRELIHSYLKKEYKLPHDWTLNILAAIYDGLYYLDVVTTYYRIYSDNTIGLGHESNYEKRVKTVSKNCCEKKEVVQLLKDNHADQKEIDESQNIYEIFELRQKMLAHRKIIPDGLLCFEKSLKYRYLYESVLMDEVAILKSFHHSEQIE